MHTMIRFLLISLAIAGFMVESSFAQTPGSVQTTLNQKEMKSNYRKLRLPQTARDLLDKSFNPWRFKEYLNEDLSPLRTCQLNADSVTDYALHVLSDTGAATTEHFLVLLSDGASYRLLSLASYASKDLGFGAYYLEIFIRGTEFESAPFDSDGDKRTVFDTDCVSVTMRDENSCRAFLFEGNKVKMFSPCD
jgi:hypothetical protein